MHACAMGEYSTVELLSGVDLIGTWAWYVGYGIAQPMATLMLVRLWVLAGRARRDNKRLRLLGLRAGWAALLILLLLRLADDVSQGPEQLRRMRERNAALSALR